MVNLGLFLVQCLYFAWICMLTVYLYRGNNRTNFIVLTIIIIFLNFITIIIAKIVPPI